MVRTQIQLTEQQSQRLHDESRRAGVSVAELIRRSVDQFLGQTSSRAAQSPSRMSMLEVVGRFDSGLNDVSARHDQYLDQAYIPSSR